MTSPNIDKARGWAKKIMQDGTFYNDPCKAAAEVIQSLPDQWVDADELRKVIANIRREADPVTTPAELAHAYTRCADAVESLLPAPPAPRTMADIEWDDEEHRFAEATVEWVNADPSTVIMIASLGRGSVIQCWNPSNNEFRNIRPGILTPTGRRYRLEPEDASTVAESEKVGPQQQTLAQDIFGNFPNHDREHEHVHWAKHIPEHDEDDFNPAHAYRDKDGDVWVANPLTGKWQVLDDDIGDDTLPSVYGPYTRIDKEGDR